MLITFVRIIYFRVERYQHYIILRDVFQDFGKPSFLVSFRSVHQVVIILWHTIFKFPNEARIAEEDLLCNDIHVLRHNTRILCHLSAQVVLPSQKHTIYFLEYLEVDIDNSFIACFTLLQLLYIVRGDSLLHILEDFTNVHREGIHVRWKCHLEVVMIHGGSIL